MLCQPEAAELTIQHTHNFVWSTSDILGHGATCHVYKGTEKVSVIYKNFLMVEYHKSLWKL